MPVIKSAKKKMRADTRKQIINRKTKEKIKLSLKAFVSKPSKENLDVAYSVLDLAAKKKLIPKQRADRKKSRLAALVQASPKKNTASKPKTRSRKSKSA